MRWRTLGAGRDTAGALKGLWWKSLVVAWLLTRVIGLAVAVTDSDPPDFVGYVVLAAVWATTWYVWRRRVRHAAGLAAGGGGPLRQMQLLVAACALAMTLFGAFVAALEPDDLERTDVAIVPIAVALAVVGALSLLVSSVWFARLPSDARHPSELVGQYRARFFARVALAQSPALLAFGAVFLVGEAWVYAIGLAASLAGLAVALPTPSRARRDQQRLRSSGSTLDLLGVLSVERATPPA